MGKACKKSGTPDEQDWTEFEGAYAATGRPPFSPRQMTGLIVYGVMQGVHSLRELERLARWRRQLRSCRPNTPPRAR
jgi:transposase